jgi:hypothetical protein
MSYKNLSSLQSYQMHKILRKGIAQLAKTLRI